MDDMEKQVREIIADELCVDIEQVVPDAKLVDDLGADSLDQIEVIMRLEEYFEIEMPDEDTEPIATVADVVTLVRRLAGEI